MCFIVSTDGNNQVDTWAAALSSNSFRLLCFDGGVRPIQEYQSCNLGKVPAPKVCFSGFLLWFIPTSCLIVYSQ